MSDAHHFGATGDGQTDDTEAIRHALSEGDGLLRFARGTYRITSTLEIDLDKTNRIGLDGSAGTAKIVMAGPGPAFRFTGTHLKGSAHPPSFEPRVWSDQRLPTVLNLEIEGAHPEADGIEALGTMQSTFEGVALCSLRHGIRLTQRARNVIISHCHIYDNTGIGIFLDGVNLHQINIVGSHISYNRLGGIRIERSEIRNLQITGNDIEYNNHRAHDTDPEPTAEIWVDTTAPGATVNEVTIASNTIQATLSPGGCNIRILESLDAATTWRDGGQRPPGLWAISGNIIGSQENNVHLTGCHGVTLSGNCIYSCGHRNLLVERSSQILVTGCLFRRHTQEAHAGVRFVDSVDGVITGCQLSDETETGQASGASLLELERCERFTISGCQIRNGVPYGLHAVAARHVSVTGCTILENRPEFAGKAAVRFTGAGHANLLAHNTLKGKVTTDLAPDSAVQASDNLLD